MDNTPCKQTCNNCKDFMYFGDGSSGMGKCVFGRETTTRTYIYCKYCGENTISHKGICLKCQEKGLK